MFDFGNVSIKKPCVDPICKGLVFCLATFGQSAFSATLSLYPQINLSEKAISLGQLGKIHADQNVERKLSKIKFNVDDLISKSKKNDLEKSVIEAIVKQRVAHIDSLLVVVGPARVKIKRNMVEVSDSFLLDAIDDLQTEISSHYSNVKISTSTKFLNFPADGKGNWRLRPLEFAKVRAHSCFWFDRYFEGKVNGSVPFWVDIQAEKSVPIVTVKHQKGELLSASSLRYENRSISKIQSEPATIVSGVEYVVSSLKLPGEMIGRDDIYLRPEVIQGETILVRSVIGSITVLAQAIALEEGMVGDRVKIKIQGSDDILRVVVTGPGIAEVRGS